MNKTCNTFQGEKGGFLLCKRNSPLCLDWSVVLRPPIWFQDYARASAHKCQAAVTATIHAQGVKTQPSSTILKSGLTASVGRRQMLTPLCPPGLRWSDSRLVNFTRPIWYLLGGSCKPIHVCLICIVKYHGVPLDNGGYVTNKALI